MLRQHILRSVVIGLFWVSSLAVQAMPMTKTVTQTKEVAVFGHLNPDTDTIATAIGFATWLRLKNVNAKAYRLGELNKETQFVLRMAGVAEPDILPENLPDDSKVALIDHNESQQSAKNLTRMEVAYAIDHHKLGDLTTQEACYLRFEPVGCTATILAKLYLESNMSFDQTTAILIISAIISDTLFFRSPTTTDDDRRIVNHLQPIANINNLASYANQLFEAKSDLTGFTTQQILLLDYKTFIFKNEIWGVGVCETWYPIYPLERKNELLYEMGKEKQTSHLNGILFSIIDILQEKNMMLILGEPENTVVRAAFNVTVTDSIADLGPRISRKKQIIPPLEEYFNSTP